MALNLILASSVLGLAICVGFLIAQNRQLWVARNHLKDLWQRELKNSQEWEQYHWKAVRDLEDVVEKFRPAEAETAPASHNVQDIDPEEQMRESDDPVWSIVQDCRAAGVMQHWLYLHPQFKDMQLHRIYGEFATFILQLPENEQNVGGVDTALRELSVNDEWKPGDVEKVRKAYAKLREEKEA